MLDSIKIWRSLWKSGTGMHQDVEVSLRRRSANGLHQDQTPSGGLSDEEDIWSFPADKEGRQTVGTLTDETFSHICCQITAELDSIESCWTGQRVHPQRKNLIKTNPLAFIAFTNNVKIYLDIAIVFLSFASLILFQLSCQLCTTSPASVFYEHFFTIALKQ